MSGQARPLLGGAAASNSPTGSKSSLSGSVGALDPALKRAASTKARPPPPPGASPRPPLPAPAMPELASRISALQAAAGSSAPDVIGDSKPADARRRTSSAQSAAANTPALKSILRRVSAAPALEKPVPAPQMPLETPAAIDDAKAERAQAQQELLVRVNHEFDTTAREAFQLLDREMAVERRRRQGVELRWTQAAADPATAVPERSKKQIRRDWRKMDQVFMARKREMLDVVMRNFEAKFLFATGSRSEARQQLRDLHETTFRTLVRDFLRKTHGPQVDAGRLEVELARLCAAAEAPRAGATPLDGVLDDSSDDDNLDDADDNASGGSTPLAYGFSFNSLADPDVSTSQVVRGSSALPATNEVSRPPSIAPPERPSSASAALSSDAADPVSESEKRPSELDIVPEDPSAVVPALPQPEQSTSGAEACRKPTDTPGAVEPREITASPEPEEPEPAPAPEPAPPASIVASIRLASRNTSGSAANLPAPQSVAAPPLSQNSAQATPPAQAPETARLSLGRRSVAPTPVRDANGIVYYYPDVYDDAFLREVIVPELLSIVEENHIMRGSKLLPYVLPLKSSTTLKRMLTFWRPSASPTSGSSSALASASPPSAGPTQIGLPLPTTQTVGGATAGSSGLKGLSRRLTLGRKSFSGSPTPADGDNVAPPASPPAVPSAATQVFGVPLNELCQRDQSTVPLFLLQCGEYMEAHGLAVSGVFRMAPSARKLDAFRTAIDSGDRGAFTAEGCNAHVVASALKTFLRELPEPLMGGRLWKLWLRVGRVEDSVLRLRLTRLLVAFLPTQARHTLRAVIAILRRVSANALVTFMDANNLALCIAPSLVRPGGAPPAAATNLSNSGDSAAHDSPLASPSAQEAASATDEVNAYMQIKLVVKTMIDHGDHVFELPDGLLAKYVGAVKSARSVSAAPSQQSLDDVGSSTRPQSLARPRSVHPPLPTSVPPAVPPVVEPVVQPVAQQPVSPASVASAASPETPEALAASEPRLGQSISLWEPPQGPPPPVPPSPVFLARSNSSLARSPAPQSLNASANAPGPSPLAPSPAALAAASSLRSLVAAKEAAAAASRAAATPNESTTSLNPALPLQGADALPKVEPSAVPAAAPATMQRRKTLRQRLGTKLGFGSAGAGSDS